MPELVSPDYEAIRKQAYYQAGGKDPGQRTTDKLAGTISGAVSGYKTWQDITKQAIEMKKTELESQKLKQETTPISETLVTPQVQATLGQAQNAPIPQQDLVSGHLDTMQQGIDTATQQALAGQTKWGNMTPAEYSKISAGGLRDIQGQMTQQKMNNMNDMVWVDTTSGKQTEKATGVQQPAGTVEMQRDQANKLASQIVIQLLKGKEQTLTPEAMDYWSTYVAKTGGLPSNMGFGMPQLRKGLLEGGAKKGTESGQGAAEAAKNWKGQMTATTAISGNAKVQDSKVNQAVDLQNLLVQNYDPAKKEFVIPPAQHAELALGLARLLSPTGQVAVELEQQLRQQTGRESLANMLIFAGADPKKVGGTTQSVTRYLAHTISRQGRVARDLRDKYGGKGGTNFDESVLINILSDNNQQTTEPGQKDQFGFTIGEVKQNKLGLNLKYVGNDQWQLLK